MFKIEYQWLELIWTLIPCLLLVVIGTPSLIYLYQSENFVENPRLTIHVIGHQWYWTYEYKDFNELTFDSYIIPILSLKEGIYRLLEVDNHLILPFQIFVRFLVSSADVLHSFALPRIGIKVDANPGRLNQIISIREFPQIVFGQCSEICGANHRFIPIVIEFSNISLFLNWIKIFSQL